VPQIEVAFDIDANGIVHVSAKDLATGKEQKIRIETSSGLSKEEIDKMVKEAKLHESEDKTKRELVDARNQLDSIIYATEKSIKEHGDKVTADEKKKIEEAIEKGKKTLTSEKPEELKKVTEEIAKSAHKLAEEMYKEAAKKQEAEKGKTAKPDTAKEKKDDDVVDAEYKVDDEKKDEK